MDDFSEFCCPDRLDELCAPILSGFAPEGISEPLSYIMRRRGLFPRDLACPGVPASRVDALANENEIPSAIEAEWIASRLHLEVWHLWPDELIKHAWRAFAVDLDPYSLVPKYAMQYASNAEASLRLVGEARANRLSMTTFLNCCKPKVRLDKWIRGQAIKADQMRSAMFVLSVLTKRNYTPKSFGFTVEKKIG